jgi:hypothetical protein
LTRTGNLGNRSTNHVGREMEPCQFSFHLVSGSDIVCRGAGFFKMSSNVTLGFVSALLEDRDLWTFDWFFWNVGADVAAQSV